VYQYQAQNSDENADPNNPNEWSPSTPVPGKTFELTFDGMLNPQKNAGGWAGRTLVQRIEPGFPLIKSSIVVQIIVQASAASGASINRIYISQADPNRHMEPWQPFTDLTQVPLPQHPFIVPAGAPVPLPPFAYPLDNSKPLLIAVDFSASPASGVKHSDRVPITRAAVYYIQGAEAALQTRSAGYTLVQDGDPTHSHVDIIANIFVFVG
jgi:hypothetical protein